MKSMHFVSHGLNFQGLENQKYHTLYMNNVQEQPIIWSMYLILVVLGVCQNQNRNWSTKHGPQDTEYLQLFNTG